MKSKLLLCFIALGLLSASARVSADHSCKFYQAPSPHPIVVKQVDVPQNGETAKAQLRKARAEQVIHQVDFVLSFDADLQSVDGIKLISKDLSFDNWDCDLYELVNGSNIMSIPEGEYDIVVTFNHYSEPNGWMPLCFRHVIREQVRIDQNMSLYFSSDEAENHIHFQTITAEGEPVNTGKIFVDEEGEITWSTKGNTDDVLWYTYLINKEYGILETVSGNFGVEYEGSYQSPNYEQLADVYINDVSDRYAFYAYRVAHSGTVFYTSSLEVQGATDNVTVSNDPSDFTLFEDFFPSLDHENEDTYISLCQYCVKPDDANLMPFKVITLTQPLDGNVNCKYYIGASTNTSQIGMIPMILPLRSYSIEYTYPWGETEVDYQPIIIGTPVVKADRQIKFVNNGVGSKVYGGTGFYFDHTASLDENAYELGDIYSYSRLYPGHPAFSYNVDRKKGVYYNNIPVLVSCPFQEENIDVWEDEEGNEYTEIYRQFNFLYNYIGRFGENNPADVRNAKMDIVVNGETLYSGKGVSSIQLDELLNGEVEATITDEACAVDEMEGANKAQLHFTLGVDDETPPTLTMLHFVDDNGDVTDRFENASEGKLEFSAGDFNRKYSEKNWSYYDRFAPTTVEVSYSPYGEDEWSVLDVEEVPEYYWPIMGWFYTSSLGDVTGTALNGWFDLKILLVDEAGNWQEQVISPAFRIENQAISAVDAVREINAHEVARYNLAGQRINDNARGIVIVKMSDGSARKILIP
ncbi:MAG: hypothetical protein IKQ89_00050 [Muribaculaceae bacterium]|nr:hypothetical protein [Muribaculaceae bacterium]